MGENKEENEINLSGIHKNEDIIQAVDVCKISATSPSESELHLKKSDQIESDEQSQNIAEKIVLLASLNAKIELLESRLNHLKTIADSDKPTFFSNPSMSDGGPSEKLNTSPSNEEKKNKKIIPTVLNRLIGKRDSTDSNKSSQH